jgi:hypothetical protein
MKFRFLIAALALWQIGLCPSVSLAGGPGRILSPGEKRAYHDCLYASFIERYCRFHAWGWSEAAFRECVIANGAGRIPPGVPYWGWGSYHECRARVQQAF